MILLQTEIYLAKWYVHPSLSLLAANLSGISLAHLRRWFR